LTTGEPVAACLKRKENQEDAGQFIFPAFFIVTGPGHQRT